MITQYDVAVIVQAEAWLTVEAESEDDAAKVAAQTWSYSDLQNGVVSEVLFKRDDGVWSA